MSKGFLDIRRMRYVLAVAEAGSVSAAARRMNVAQPALSYHLAEVERMLGGTLFDRRTTGMVPTDLGRLFIDHALQILALVGTAEEELISMSGGETVMTLARLAIIPSIAATLSPRLMAQFARHMPDCAVHLIEARSDFAEDLIASGKADFALQLIARPNMTDPPITWEEMFLLSTTPMGDGQVDFATVAASPLVLPARENPLRKFLEIEAARQGLSLNVVIETDGFEPRRRLVRANMGTTVIGAHCNSPDLLEAGICVTRIVNPALRRPILLSARKGIGPRTRKIFRDVLVKLFDGS